MTLYDLLDPVYDGPRNPDADPPPGEGGLDAGSVRSLCALEGAPIGASLLSEERDAGR